MSDEIMAPLQTFMPTAVWRQTLVEERRTNKKTWTITRHEVSKAPAGVYVDRDGSCVSRDGSKVQLSGLPDPQPAAELWLVNPKDQEEDTRPDNATLTYLGAPHLLKNLESRHMSAVPLIHTYTAHLLIVTNPFELIKGLYEPDKESAAAHPRLRYRVRDVRELADKPPHVFALAERAYHALHRFTASQSIIISGESGAGKTESAKRVMEYLAWRGGGSHGDDDATSVLSDLARKVLDVNPLLEALGNAKTTRNENSSRFGKLTKICFEEVDGAMPRIMGAQLSTYLLEKSRCVRHATGERGYHSFYALLAGARSQRPELPPAGWAELSLRASEGATAPYKLLTPEGKVIADTKTAEVRQAEDTKRFREMVLGLSSIGYATDEIVEIFRVLSAVLMLGEIAISGTGTRAVGEEGGQNRFRSEPTDTEVDIELLAGRGARADGQEAPLQVAARLLKADAAQLEALLTKSPQTTSNIEITLKSKKAMIVRNMLMKLLYAHRAGPRP